MFQSFDTAGGGGGADRLAALRSAMQAAGVTALEGWRGLFVNGGKLER